MVMDLLQRAATDPRVARSCLEAALRAANDRIWVHRNVARLYREVLGDVAMARRVLDELSPLTCIEWRLAAAAWVELGDLPAATACLERAAANARTAPDLCTIAMGYRDSGYLDEGQLLLDGADALATRATDCWTVANAHAALGDRALALTTLERGLRDATAVTELVTLVQAFATYGVGADTLRGQLALAERRAGSVRDWLELAMAHHLIVFERASADRCVEQASGLATSAQHEREIAVTRARVWQLELLDDERPKLAPAQLLRPGSRSFGWDRDPARLLGWLRARLPRTSIDSLTRPGEFFINDDLVALLEISKTGLVPHPLPAYLEVLRTEAWREGFEVDHLTRAFACTLTCIEDAASWVPDRNEPTIAILLESCIALGPGAVEGALALFAAMADAYDATQSTTQMRHMTLFAELGLVLAAAWLDPTDPRIDLLTTRLIEDERGIRDSRNRAGPSWLLGLATASRRDLLWRSLGSQILGHPRHARLASLLA